MSEIPSGTVTFLFTDIEGSTRLLSALGGEGYHAVLAEHQRILRKAVSDTGGREIDTQGDAFFFAFRKAKDAVAAAIAGQQALFAFAWPDGLPVRVRMGLDTGEPTVGGNRYVGLGVHRTARIMSAAHGGQVLLSDTTRNLANDELPAGVDLRDLGEQRLKDLERPVRLYQIVAPGLPAKFPRLRTLDAGLLRRRVVAPAVGVLLAAIIVGVVLGTRSNGGVTVAPNSVGIIDPTTNRVVGQTPVGIRPGSVATAGTTVWVANQDGTVTRIDAKTGARVKTIPLTSTPTSLAATRTTLWVAEGATGALVRVDSTIDSPVKTINGLAGPIRVSGGPLMSVALGNASVYVAFGSSIVRRIDPQTYRVVANGAAGFGAAAMAYGRGAVWVANSIANTVSWVNPETAQKVLNINVGQAPRGVTFGGGTVWVSDFASNTVSRVDPTTRAVTTIQVGRGPIGVAFGLGAVWVANSEDGTVSRINPGTGKVVSRIRVGGAPNGLAVGDGLVWVSVDAPLAST